MQIVEAPGTDPPLRLADLGADELAGAGDLVGEIFAGRLLGFVARGAFPAAGLARVVARLEGGASPLRAHAAEYFKGYSYGRILVVSPPDLTDYFREAAEFRAGCAALFAGTVDFEPRVEALLGQAAGGRPVRLLQSPDGAPYAPASIRGVVPGGQIDLHCENETLGFAPMRALATLVDPAAQLSFYVALALPDAGGELHVHGVRFGEGPGRALASMERAGAATLRALAPHGAVVPRVGVGDLLVFNAGAHFHRVSPVEGARTRWTMGGFLARGRGGAGLYYWS